MAMPMAAADPAVPGAVGEYPQPNQVEMALATLVRIIIRGAGLQSCGRRPRRPVPARTWLISLREERVLEAPRRPGGLPHEFYHGRFSVRRLRSPPPRQGAWSCGGAIDCRE